MTLSPAAVEKTMELVAVEIADRLLANVNLDDLLMIDLSSAANYLGIPLDRAAKVLPVVQLGPRTRRVRVSDFKAYQEANMKRPK